MLLTLYILGSRLDGVEDEEHVQWMDRCLYHIKNVQSIRLRTITSLSSRRIYDK